MKTFLTDLLQFAILNALVWRFAKAMQLRLTPNASAWPEKFADRLLLWAVSVVAMAAVLGFLGLLTLQGFWAGAIALFAASLPVGGAKSVFQADLPSLKSATIAQKTALCLTLLVPLFHLIWAAATPTPPWDAFVYHLVFPATWLQQGRIGLIAVPFGDQAGTYFPSNGELLFAWTLAPFHSDQIVNALQLLFLAGCAAAVWRLARAEGAGTTFCFWAALPVLLIPGLLHQARAAEVDIIFAFFFLCALSAGIRCARSGDAGAAALFGLAFGALLGTKYVGVAFGLLTLPPFLRGWLRSPRRLLDIAAVILLAVAAGGFWYARNFLVTGNPIFPFELGLGGTAIFPGAYDKTAMLNSVFHTDSLREIFGLYRDALGDGLGALALFAAFVAALQLLLSGVKKPGAVWLALLPAVMVAVQIWIVPYNTQIRFSFGALCLCFALLGKAMQATPNIRTLAILAIPGAALLSLAKNKPFIDMTAHLFASGAAGGTALGLPPWLALDAAILAALGLAGLVFTGGKKMVQRAAAVGLAAVLVAWTAAAAPNYERLKAEWYKSFPIGQAWGFLSESLRRPATIAFTGTDLCYGLFGPGLKNRILYANINGQADWKFHQYVKAAKETGTYKKPQTDRVDIHRQNPDYGLWLDNLHSVGADGVFIAMLHQTDRAHLPHDARGFPIEADWAASHPETFRLIYKNPQVEIYWIADRFRP